MANDDTELDLDQLNEHRAEWEQERDDADESWMTVIVPYADEVDSDEDTNHELPDSVINPTIREQQERALLILEGYIAEVRYALQHDEPFAPPTGYYFETNVIDPLCWSDGV